MASRKEEVCQKVAAEITAATGRAAVGIGSHVGRWTDCDRLVEVAYDTFGRVDILVNNAGMSPLYPSLAEVTEELLDKVVAVNLKGAFRLSTLIGSRMAAGDGGFDHQREQRGGEPAAPVPLGRGGQPGEILGAALYLASEASSYTTGASIRIDGGASLGGGIRTH